MSKTALKSPKESVASIAALFRALCDDSVQGQFIHKPVFLSVKEDICFENNWLALGEIILKSARNEEETSLGENAVRFGFYEWRMNTFDALKSECLKLMGVKDEGKERDDEKAENDKWRALQSIIDASRRMSLMFPCFDADIVSSMPFQRPTTVIADTCAIAQGGVDFLIRFLCPMARLKIPAVVSMEILNQSDRYFERRRKFSKTKANKVGLKPRILYEHVLGQAGQRSMLRFELHSDIEVERTALFSDPLRNLFNKGHENDWQDLNIWDVNPSYRDRLILETARQHMSTVSPGHPVLLMTSDEGLARMALAEGIRPFFFHAGRPPEQYGKILTGTRFHPFTGEVFSIPLQNLLWEFAVTFGNARLATEDGSIFFEVSAINQEMSWQPFHSKDDLLRVSWGGFDLEQEAKDTKQSQNSPIEVQSCQTEIPDKVQRQETGAEKAISGKASATKLRSKLGAYHPNTVYRFDLNVFLKFIPILLKKVTVPITGEGTPLQGKARTTLNRYLGFMSMGGFISEVENGIQATDAMQKLWDALLRRDLESISQCFCSVPSFEIFLNNLESTRQIKVDFKAPESKRPSPAYIQIAEICGRALRIPQEAIYGTFLNPSLDEFIELAIKTYIELRKGEDYILTGLWLETLARVYSIHPVKTRDLLDKAQAAGMIERYTQGSTPDTRFEDHALTVLQIEKDRPLAKQVCLYHGDFIIPGKASVSIRLERK